MHDNYTPRQNGITKSWLGSVSYSEQVPDQQIRDVVHCLWSLKSAGRLSEDFTYTVMPDACIDIVFDATGHTEPILMTPHLRIEKLNLGREFHYIGIRFKPGVFTGKAIDVQKVVGGQLEARQLFAALNSKPQQTVRTISDLITLVRRLKFANIVERNILIENVIKGVQEGLSIDSIANKTGYSPRQLRRKVHSQTGFSPVQLQRVLRFQQTLSTKNVAFRFSDQSHLIKEFKAITGVSYKSFVDRFV